MDLAAHKGDRTDRGPGMSVPGLTRRGDAALDDSDPSGDTPPQPPARTLSLARTLPPTRTLSPSEDATPGEDPAPGNDPALLVRTLPPSLVRMLPPARMAHGCLHSRDKHKGPREALLRWEEGGPFQSLLVWRFCSGVRTCGRGRRTAGPAGRLFLLPAASVSLGLLDTNS